MLRSCVTQILLKVQFGYVPNPTFLEANNYSTVFIIFFSIYTLPSTIQTKKFLIPAIQ